MCVYHLMWFLCFMTNPIEPHDNVTLLKFYQQIDLQLNPKQLNEMKA